MKIIKRSGIEEAFDRSKITAAVTKANESVPIGKRLGKKQIETIGDNVTAIATKRKRALSVEEIQDIVENEIMDLKAFEVARKYITYRYSRQLVRKSNTTDEQIILAQEFAQTNEMFAKFLLSTDENQQRILQKYYLAIENLI